jgi:hypothetical protein
VFNWERQWMGQGAVVPDALPGAEPQPSQSERGE